MNPRVGSRLGQEQGREDGPTLGKRCGVVREASEAPFLFRPSWTKRMLGFIVLRLTGPTHGFLEVVTEAQRGQGWPGTPL